MKKIIAVLLLVVSSALIIKYIPVSFAPASTITVSGEAKADQLPQIANFSASVIVTNPDKQTSVNEVNLKMAALIKAVKDFGINEKDIQTQQLSVYQTKEVQPEIMIYPPIRSGKDVWQASNSISVTLRDITKASALADLLQGTESANVSGPNYSLDDTTEAQAALLSKAIDNAREKAAKIAKASKRKLGKVITVSEGGSSYPRPFAVGGMMALDKAVSAPVEPGAETIYQSVTVTFELK